jgi:fatty acid desaturase
MLLLRGLLLTALWMWHAQAVFLYLVAYTLFLHVLDFFDSFHHTFEQHFVEADEAIPKGRTHAYEQANTYSNLVSVRWPWLNLLVLNFGYHNAHHERPGVPWYRLPALHRSLYGGRTPAVMPVRSLLRSWHVHRVERLGANASAAQVHPPRPDDLIGAHGVSFLTVV